GNARTPCRNDFFSFASMGRSRTSSQKQATAIIPGSKVHKNTFRYEWLVACKIHNAVNGPRIAPSVSINRSSPNARPYAPGGTSAANKAFFAGERTPRPNHAAERPANTCSAWEATPKDAVAIAVNA